MTGDTPEDHDTRNPHTNRAHRVVLGLPPAPGPRPPTSGPLI